MREVENAPSECILRHLEDVSIPVETPILLEKLLARCGPPYSCSTILPST